MLEKIFVFGQRQMTESFGKKVIVPQEVIPAAGKALLVYTYLLSNDPGFNPTIDYIATKLKMNPKTVSRHIKHLKDQGMIEVTTKRLDREKTKNSYLFFPPEHFKVNDGIPKTSCETYTSRGLQDLAYKRKCYWFSPYPAFHSWYRELGYPARNLLAVLLSVAPTYPVSLSVAQDLSGLSRNGVLAGRKELREKGLLNWETEGSSTVWTLQPPVMSDEITDPKSLIEKARTLMTVCKRNADTGASDIEQLENLFKIAKSDSGQLAVMAEAIMGKKSVSKNERAFVGLYQEFEKKFSETESYLKSNLEGALAVRRLNAGRDK